MLLNLKTFKICIMHEFVPQKAKICKHARKKYQYLESLSHEMNICSLRSVTILYKNMNLHGSSGSVPFIIDSVYFISLVSFLKKKDIR